MKTAFNTPVRKTLYGIMLAGMVFAVFGMSGAPAVRAQEDGTGTPAATAMPTPTHTPGPNRETYNPSDDDLTSQSDPQPDLVPYLPPPQDPIVISPVRGTSTNDTLYAGQPIYIDWGFANNGDADVGTSYYVDLYIDEQRLIHYPFEDIGAGYYYYFEDWADNWDSSGWHTVQLVADPENTVSESNEENNIWEGQFYWEPDTGIPVAPDNLTVGDATFTSLTLTWADNSNDESGFNVYRCCIWDGSDWAYAYVDSVGADVTTYTQTDLHCGINSYSYKVSAYNDYGESPLSNTGEGGTDACPPAELSITSLTVFPANPFTNDGFFYVEIGVQNLSENDAYDFWVDLSFDPDDPPGECGVWGDLELIINDGLPANSINYWVAVISVGDLTTTTHQLYAFVDSNCMVPETNETNNVAEPIAFTISAPPPPPSHDDFDDAILISPLAFSDNVDVSGATRDPDDRPVLNCSLGPGLASVWYKYTPAANTRLALDTLGSDYDTFLAVWRGSRSRLAEIACNDDSGGTLQSALQVNLEANITYYIEVAQYPTEYGSALSASSTEPALYTLPAPEEGTPPGAQPTLEEGIEVSAADLKPPPDVEAQAGGMLNFHASVVTYTITGKAGIAGATLNYTDGTPVTAGSDGSYTITVPYNWSGTITPSMPGYTFTPANLDYGATPVTDNLSDQDFTALVTITGSAGVAGATLSYTGGTPITAGSNGSYTITVPYNWSGTITPSKTGYTFTPASRSYSTNPVTDNLSVQNFTALVTITGNAGESGVTLRYTDGTAKSVTSASNGRYTITVPYNWSGSVTPSKTGLTFSPASKSYSHITANQASQNYSAVMTIPSTGSYDGYILESTETSNIGGSVNATNTYFVIGDASADRQYRALLAFNTASLPDTATIQSVVVKIKQYGSPVGSNPFSLLGSLYTDIRKGYFGTGLSLQTSDFNAAASTTSVAATFGKTPVSAWYSATLTSTARTYVNKTSWTELRLRFSKDDDNDGGADYMRFCSGNYSTSSYRPQLIVTYTLP